MAGGAGHESEVEIEVRERMKANYWMDLIVYESANDIGPSHDGG
jgi:hypothetical protein